MITILNTDKEKLMEQISRCSGAVYLHMKDGTTCDLKNDTLASGMLKLLELPKTAIMLSLADPGDFPGFLKYMMEGNQQ